MSASEKLKALEVGATTGEWRVDGRHLWVGGKYRFTTLMHSDADARLTAALSNALPQIVAVVEELEHIQEPLLENPPMNDYERFVAERSAAALAALEEALS